MTQKAILEFEDDSGKHFLSGDYQGQATGTHDTDVLIYTLWTAEELAAMNVPTEQDRLAAVEDAVAAMMEMTTNV